MKCYCLVVNAYCLRHLLFCYLYLYLLRYSTISHLIIIRERYTILPLSNNITITTDSIASHFNNTILTNLFRLTMLWYCYYLQVTGFVVNAARFDKISTQPNVERFYAFQSVVSDDNCPRERNFRVPRLTKNGTSQFDRARLVACRERWPISPRDCIWVSLANLWVKEKKAILRHLSWMKLIDFRSKLFHYTLIHVESFGVYVSN